MEFKEFTVLESDTSNNTWFSSNYNSFELGCELSFINGQVTSNEYLPIGSTFLIIR